MIAAGLTRCAWIAAAALALAASTAQASEETAAPACECTERVKPLDASGHYDLIFFGQASVLGADDPDATERQNEFVEFSVEGLWKGPQQRRLRVHTSDGDPLCAFRFILGKRYLVFARLEEVAYSNRYRTSACARTAEAAKALPDLAILGSPAERFEP